jgi:hypothetical protein
MIDILLFPRPMSSIDERKYDATLTIVGKDINHLLDGSYPHCSS